MWKPNLTFPLNKFTTDKYLHSCSNILNNIFTREQSQLCDVLVDVKRLLTVLCGRINARRLLQPAAPPLNVPYLSRKTIQAGSQFNDGKLPIQ